MVMVITTQKCNMNLHYAAFLSLYYEIPSRTGNIPGADIHLNACLVGMPSHESILVNLGTTPDYSRMEKDDFPRK